MRRFTSNDLMASVMRSRVETFVDRFIEELLVPKFRGVIDPLFYPKRRALIEKRLAHAGASEPSS